MQKIKICSDSTCDLSLEILKELSVDTIPLNVVCNDVSFKDNVDIKPSDIYRMVDVENKRCYTAAINVFDLQEFFKQQLEQAENVVYVSISSDLSASYQNACTAAEEFDGRVTVIDSRNLSTGVGYIVYEAALMAKAGSTAEEIAENLKTPISHMEASFVIDTLEYLKRGGRCSALMAFGANLLKIKPCIEVVNGKLTVGKTYKGSLEKSLKRYVRDRLEGRDDIMHDRIFITHAACPSEIVAEVKALIPMYYQFDKIIETDASCTVSCHCGPGTLGILFMRR